MHRASNAFSVLQATAVVVSLAILLWSFGLPSIRFAEAANVTSFSDTLSTSEPDVASDHTISFVTPSGMLAGEKITLTFPVGFDGIDLLTTDDLDLIINGVEQDLDGTALDAVWGVNPSGQVIDFVSGTTTVGENATVTIKIGKNASHQAPGVNQIVNPLTPNPYQIDVAVGDDADDEGTTIVVILDQVTVTASVETVFTFTIDGVNGDTSVGANATTTGDSTATTIPFGVLEANTASTAAQSLNVVTNAANGFVVTVQADQQLTSANGADIDGFSNGSYTTTPLEWDTEPPLGGLGQENEYGHWGLTSNDTTLTDSLNDLYNGGLDFVSASTSPVEVFRHDGPTDGSQVGTGTANVIYRVEITALQEAADDYTATLTYVATPIF